MNYQITIKDMLNTRKNLVQGLFKSHEKTCSEVIVYKFNSKELDAETGLYYYGARYYTPEIGIWLSVDPMSDERPSLSPYNYCQLNPVMRVDPTGMLDWEPEVTKNGSINYKAEKGDNIVTLKNQYGLSNKEALNIFDKAGIDPAKSDLDGKSITGQNVEDATGKNILKLDWSSNMATDQRKVNQIMFAIDYNQEKGNGDFDMNDFNSNTYNSFAGFKAKNLTIKSGKDRIPIVNMDASFDGRKKINSFYTTCKNINGTNDMYYLFSDPKGAPRMSLRINGKHSEKFEKHYGK